MKPPVADTRWPRVPLLAGALRPWLTDRGSLTQRIQTHCRDFRVDVVFQGLRRPEHDEATLVARGEHDPVLVREVYLYADDVPVVFAHSVARWRDVHGVWRALAGLGNRSLGSRLFSDARVQRCPLHQRRLAARHPLHRRAVTAVPGLVAPLWARRSLFLRNNSPILVTEVFLPGILEL